MWLDGAGFPLWALFADRDLPVVSTWQWRTKGKHEEVGVLEGGTLIHFDRHDYL